MAVTLTVAALAAAIRVGSTTAEVAEVTRLLAVSTTAVEKFAPDAPSDIQNEAVVRMAGWMFDAPAVTRAIDPLRASGAVALLNPYRVHRAGLVGGTVPTETPASPDPAPPGGVDLAAVNAAIAEALDAHADLPNVHHTPPDPDGYDDTELRQRVQRLYDLTTDLHAGPLSTGWSDATDDAQGGLAAVSAVDLATVRAVTDWTAQSLAHEANQTTVARIPVDADPRLFRMKVEGTGDRVYFEGFNTLQRLGESADEAWALYFVGTYGDAVTTVTLQVTGAVAHLGESRFDGILGDGADGIRSQLADLLTRSRDLHLDGVTRFDKNSDVAVAGIARVAISNDDRLAIENGDMALDVGAVTFTATLANAHFGSTATTTDEPVIRLASSEDRGDWRVLFDQVAFVAGGWVQLTVTNGGAGYDYWLTGKVDRTSEVALYKNTEETTFHGTLAGGIVDAAALDSLIAQRLLPAGNNDAQRGYRVARASNTDGYTLVPAGGLPAPTYTLIGTAPIGNAKIIEFTSGQAVGTAFKAAWAAGTYRRFAMLLKIGGSERNVSIAEFPSGFGLPNPIPSQTVTIRFALSHDNDSATDAYFQLTSSGVAWTGLIGEEAPASSVIELYGVA